MKSTEVRPRSMKQEGHKDAHSEVVEACRVLYASHLGDTVCEFAATRDAQGLDNHRRGGF